MLYRFAIILVCVVLFINSCNSLISTQIGTHKLRAYDMATVMSSGVGDADFLEISDATLTGEFVHVPNAEDATKNGIILYPVLTPAQIDAQKAGQRVQPAILAWTEYFDPGCVARKDCVPTGQHTLRGVTSRPKKAQDRRDELTGQYDWPDNVIYLEVGRAPMAWHWHLIIMVLTLVTGLILEGSRQKKAKQQARNA